MRRAALLLVVAACVVIAPTAASARTTGPHGAKAGRGDVVGKPGARARGVVVRRRAARRPAKRPAAGRWAALPVVGAVGAVTGDAAGTAGAAAPPAAVPGPAATPTPGPGHVPDLPENAERSVAVLSDEWSFTLSQPSVRAGSVRVEFDNSRAEDAHELATRGADLTFGHTPAGRIVAKTFTLSPGTYTLFCPLPQHEALGMRATLTVTR